MNTPLITWCCVVGILTAVILAHTIIYLTGRKHKRKKIFGIASEREILFIPGDNTENDDYDCEDWTTPVIGTSMPFFVRICLLAAWLRSYMHTPWNEPHENSHGIRQKRRTVHHPTSHPSVRDRHYKSGIESCHMHSISPPYTDIVQYKYEA